MTIAEHNVSDYQCVCVFPKSDYIYTQWELKINNYLTGVIYLCLLKLLLV